MTQADADISAWMPLASTLLRDNGMEEINLDPGRINPYEDPILRFKGSAKVGYRMYAVCVAHDLPVKALRKTWLVDGGDLMGFHWELEFNIPYGYGDIPHHSANPPGEPRQDDMSAESEVKS